KAHILKNNFARKRWKRLGARLLAELFFPVEISEYLRAGALRELKLLVHLTNALQWHVSVKHGKKKGHENSGGHDTVLDLIAGKQNEQRDNQRAQQIHSRPGGHRRANPAHVFAQQALRGVLELGDFEILHTESLHDTIPADGLLQNLAEVPKPALTVFRRTANFSSQLSDGHDDQRHQDCCSQRHFPVEHDDNRQKYNQREAFVK